jgi:predicted dehydrogenase
VAVQGEGIMDVTTHLVDLAHWMTGQGQPFVYERDVELQSARQWPTEVPREVFARITGLRDFPDALKDRVANGRLRYLCNAELAYRLRGIPVRIESIWDLAIPEGGGDTHYAIARGTRADLVVEQNAATRFTTELTVHPLDRSGAYARALTDAAKGLQSEFPGLGIEPAGDAFRITVPHKLRTTHEEHFAAVLDEFLGYVDGGAWPADLGPNLIAKYTLLARARDLSHRAA